MSNDNDIFKINYKSEKYQTIFNNINKIFGNNYLSYISQQRLTHPYLVELFIFLRKYQYFIHYIKINKQILCSFYKEEEQVQDRILNMKQMLNLNEDNICSIKFELLPKFKKSEINFTIPNDVMELDINFHIKLINEDNKIDIALCSGTEIYITNLDKILEKIQINNINKKLSKLFDLYIEEFKEKNFKILNKFVNYIENFFPILLNDDLKKKNNENEIEEIKNEDEWTQKEQDKLEELLIKYKDIKNLKSKLKKISEEFGTKTLKQISSRYKELALKSKNKNQKENGILYNKIINQNLKKKIKIEDKKDEKENIENEHKNDNEDKLENKDKNEIKDDKEIKKNKKDKIIKKENNEKVIDEIKDVKKENKEKIIKEEKEKENKNKKEKELIKIKENKNLEEKLPILELNNKEISSITIKSVDSSYSDNSKIFNSLETTEDIIDAIISVYNKNYREHDLSLLQENSTDKMSYYVDFNKLEEEEEEDEEENENEEEESDEENEMQKKNKEIIDFYLSKDLQPSITSENLILIKNILNLGERYQVNLTGVQLNNISIVQISNIKLLLKCGKCKKVAFESKYMKLNKQKNIFYLGTVCPRCQNEIFSVFISDYIHQNNLTNAGVCYISGGIVIDYLPSIYNLECEKCGQSKTIKLRTGCLHSNDSNCRKCNIKLNFVILSSNINNVFVSDLKDLSDIKITNFEKFNFAIKDDINLDNYVKKFDKIIQEGKELPDFGACKHYRHSLRWFRFSCCNKIFPCDICHDEASDHNNEFAKTILCGFCACEQSSSNKVCQKCGKLFSKSEGGKKFWEGGKGCRDPKFMNARDSHKFTGLNKTISRKQQKKNQMKKK
jgi:uncharacterized CHY-type Zn-finger protein